MPGKRIQNKHAALKLMRKLLKKYGFKSPFVNLPMERITITNDIFGIVTSPLGLPSVTFSRNHR